MLNLLGHDVRLVRPTTDMTVVENRLVPACRTRTFWCETSCIAFGDAGVRSAREAMGGKRRDTTRWDATGDAETSEFFHVMMLNHT